MARIDLRFARWTSTDPERYGPVPVTATRLFARVRFRTTDGMPSVSWDAIVDTGAPFAVLPRRIWRDLDAAIAAPSTWLGGINQRKACQIPAAFDSVLGQLEDDSANVHGSQPDNTSA